jgi:hypothetical protein
LEYSHANYGESTGPRVLLRYFTGRVRKLCRDPLEEE